MITSTLTRSPRPDRRRRDHGRGDGQDRLRRGHGRPEPLIDPRLQARRLEVTRDRGRRRLRRLLTVLAVVALAAGAFGVTRSPLLDVDHVAYQGTSGPRSTELAAAADLRPGAPMVEVDPGAVSRRIAELPWVDTVEVVRDWPGTVVVRVTERVPVAVDATGAGIDAGGHVIGPVAADGLPEVDITTAEVGTVVDDAHRDLVAVVAAMPPDLRAEVREARVDDGEVVLVLTDRIHVRFGGAERASAKFAAIEALLDQAGRSTTAAIDVRVPSSPSLTRRPGNGA